MATAGDLIDEVLARVRDPDGLAHPRDMVRDFLDRVQIVVTRGRGLLIEDRVVATTPGQVLFPIDPHTTLRVVDVFVGNRRASPARWTQMLHARRDWLEYATVGIANVYQCWAPLGTEEIVVWPGLSGGSTNLKLREQRRPAALSSESVAISLPDEHHPLLLGMVEALLLLRLRDVEAASLALKRIHPTLAGVVAA